MEPIILKYRQIPMKFIADLHIHSKYSRATAKNLDLENLYHAAQIKGISVVGTGDFTFPAWIEEIESKLEETEPGFFSLKESIARKIDPTLPESCRNPVRFVLQTEISNIYKKEGRVRKNHNLIYFPDLKAVRKFNARLETLGNIKSDGRPILGLDAENLLEIMLETSDQGFLVPAHIWTPWFSLLGSKSGFDTIEACFGDLAHHIFAVETGLSSDPAMNWRVSGLDHVRLISNSDAHSPGYLGRNACLFNTDLDYFSLRKALETNDLDAYQGTLDMYPDQGKYHYDGHRKCNVSLNPEATAGLGGICPVCKRPLTLGVLYRVQELADRPEGFVPENRPGYTRIIPLKEILAEIFEVGPQTKKVAGYFQRAIEALGPELTILTDRSPEEIQKAGVPLLAEAILRMRSGDIKIDPGFDGEFGQVTIFSRSEKERLRGEKNLLFDPPESRLPAKKRSSPSLFSPPADPPLTPSPVKIPSELTTNRGGPKSPPGLLEGLNPPQKQAVESSARAILIQAGPGTGKTRTLTAKIAYLVSEKKTDPGSILVLTFTNKAARELAQRIETFIPQGSSQVTAATFHGFCLSGLKKYTGFEGGLADDGLRQELIRNSLSLVADPALSPQERTRGGWAGKKNLGQWDQLISRAKQQLAGPGDDLSLLAGERDPQVFKQVYQAYEHQCRQRNLVDFEDLIFLFHKALKESPDLLARVQNRFAHIFVDEYQDLNFGQYELVRLLAENSRLLVIGDPDQSIYGFRGSDNTYFKRFAGDYPGCQQIYLTQNYRSTQTILDASYQMISHSPGDKGSLKIFSSLETGQRLIIKQTASHTAEAKAVGKMIEKFMGGLSFFSMDQGAGMDMKKEYAFSDFAVLFRTKKQGETFCNIFEKQGIPFQVADKHEGFTREGIHPVMSLFRYVTARANALDYQILGNHFDLKFSGKGPRGRVALPDALSRVLEPVFARIQNRESLVCLDILRDFLGVRPLIDQNQTLGQVYENIGSLARLYPDPRGFMDHLALNQDPDLLAASVEKVSLMTLHSAKGLEFPVVFVTGCEQGLTPFARDGETIDNPEEERRLFYVAMTRAMDILCLTYAQKRIIYGRVKSQHPSFYLGDIEKRLARHETGRARAGVSQKKIREIQLELFPGMTAQG